MKLGMLSQTVNVEGAEVMRSAAILAVEGFARTKICPESSLRRSLRCCAIPRSSRITPDGRRCDLMLTQEQDLACEQTVTQT